SRGRAAEDVGRRGPPHLQPLVLAPDVQLGEGSVRALLCRRPEERAADLGVSELHADVPLPIPEGRRHGGEARPLPRAAARARLPDGARHGGCVGLVRRRPDAGAAAEESWRGHESVSRLLRGAYRGPRALLPPARARRTGTRYTAHVAGASS